MKTFKLILIKNIIKIRYFFTIWIRQDQHDCVRQIREREIENIIEHFSQNMRILELGGGSGWQAKKLEQLGFNITSIDIEGSSYLEKKIFNVKVYNGKNIPFNDKFFDIIFSSNVLEHIKNTNQYQAEISRVLKDNGIAIHLIPSSSWRIWTIITDIIKSWHFSAPHGEHASNIFHEIYVFSQIWWKKKFIENNWDLYKIKKNNIFYTGNLVLGERLSLKLRKYLSKVFGSSCNIYFLKKKL